MLYGTENSRNYCNLGITISFMALQAKDNLGFLAAKMPEVNHAVSYSFHGIVIDAMKLES